LAKAKRRTFPAAEKLRVLREADACKKLGEVGALLRREGLYSSHLTSWRRARERGELGFTKKRGPEKHRPDDRDRQILGLEGQLRRANARADRAEALVDLQKKLATVLNLSIVESDKDSE
jgi:transposase